MDLNYRPTAELAKTAVWLQDSLRYARERGRRRLVGLLETVGAQLELEGWLVSIASGEHMGLDWGKALRRGQRVPVQGREGRLRLEVARPWEHHTQDRVGRHLPNEVAYPEGSPLRYIDITASGNANDA